MRSGRPAHQGGDHQEVAMENTSRPTGHRLAALLWVIVVTMVSGASLASATASDRSSQRPVDTRAIDAFLREQVTRHGVPGLAVGVVDHGRTIMTTGYGT